MDGVKGKLHVIEDDLELWLPNIETITLGEIYARLSAQIAFEEFLRLREES